MSSLMRPLAAADAQPAPADALHALGRMAHALQWDEVAADVRNRLRLVLLDILGVTVAGARTPEMRALREVWNSSAGPVTLLGTTGTAAPRDALWLNGTASCCLELDEGNKFAQGHPAAHVVFAALAEAQSLEVSGRELLAAILAGYEVAARFGRAMRRAPQLHTHGHWGALGAAAAVARLRGLCPEQIAAAIDAAAGLVLATPWESALRGSFVRNTWVAAANVNGLTAARLAQANLASVDETPMLTLGGLLGSLDTAPLIEALGTRFDVTRGYFKRHSSCSYTHPPADACLELRAREGFDPDDVASVLVETNRLAAPLSGLDFSTRLAAMFSTPFVVAVALTEGAVLPAAFDKAHRDSPRLHALARKVEVRSTADMDERLPAERAARVSVTLSSGTVLTAEMPNPVGDADHHPFGRAQVYQKLCRLIPERGVMLLAQITDELDAEGAHAGEILNRLRDVPEDRQ